MYNEDNNYGVMQDNFGMTMNKVYGIMFLGLLITAITALYVISSPNLIEAILLNNVTFYGLIFGELALVWVLRANIHKFSTTTALGMFLLYSLLNGLTLSVVFLVYTLSSIATVFFITAGVFGVMSLYGYITKTDLSKIGHIAMFGLIGLIIAHVVNMFMQNSQLDYIISYAGVVIFMILTAYDTKKIKEMSRYNKDANIAVVGALELYLDFINLFLYLLRILGRRRD